ncbi:MAG TPA: uroporphyrinogen decarboxylase family protein [Sedimentisphaerales bacterium]|nr:uroporphyrinogen decarboxylase family protein [Sedimentisphaerales bacterium]HNU28150.1 uroporphyrinogen decarboxylase family protein [Sedimentisphaerales bacterium]
MDIFRFGDDWGHQRGVLMGPDLWRRFIKPRFRMMCELVKSKGKLVMLHSCGKVDELFDDLIECGLDIFNPFQPEVMDVFDVKKRYGDRLTFYGGISIQRTLPFGTVQQVRDEVRRLLDVVGADGGYIASPSHDIPGDAKPENLAAMIEVLQNQ